MRGTLTQRCFGVSHSPDLDRVLKLPRRTIDLTKVEDQTARYRKPGGTMNLWPIQSAALLEMEACNGGFFPIGVGHGKTLVSLLAASALASRCCVLLVPPSLRDQLVEHDIPRLSQHFNLPKGVHVVAYSELSGAATADVLERLAPDLIVADEAHSLKHKGSSRTKRFLRYMKANQATRFVALSGTMTTRSIKEFAHLIAIALREGAPVPFAYHELNDWAEALDVSPYPAPAGALLKLCQEEGHGHEGTTQDARGSEHLSSGREGNVRSRFRCRLVSTKGVVATSEGAIGTSLVIRALKPEVPQVVQEALQALRSSWEVGGEEITDVITLNRVARQLACGFYYKWAWPNGVKDYEWLEARSAWHKEIRGHLAHSARPGLDSPALLGRAARAGAWFSRSWPAWDRVRTRTQPPTEAVWLSDFLVREAVAWAKEVEEGIIWYSHHAFGQAIAKAGGLPLFGAGADTALLGAQPATHPVIVCSAQAHGQGKNLQAWSRTLFTSPRNGADMEQNLGRCHRSGQLADEVTADIFLHTAEVWEKFERAIEEARYIEATTGQRQKLLMGQVIT